MIRWALPLLLVLSACSSGVALKLLTGGGPNVAANVQAGANNVQSVGVSEVTTQELIRPKARRISQSADKGKTAIESINRAGKVVGQEGWAPWPVFAAFLFPSPLGVVVWPLLVRWNRRRFPAA